MLARGIVKEESAHLKRKLETRVNAGFSFSSQTCIMAENRLAKKSRTHNFSGMKKSLSFACFALILAGWVQLAWASDWPAWRGKLGDGTIHDKKAPVAWKLPDNLVWKTPIPGKGHASPIIVGNRIYQITAIEEKAERLLLCIDRATGKELWRKVVLKSPLERVHRLNSRASSTPTSDGERIYLSFLDKKKMFVAAYDLDGKKLWEVRPGVFSSIHGYCSSPVLWKDKVIVNGDHDGPGYLVALDKKTGKTLWKKDRPNNTRSYCTPLIRTIGGRNQMILAGSKCVASYDPDTGKQHWISDGPTEQYVASLVYNGDLLFMTCGFPKRFMQGIRPDGSGNVTKTHVAWEITKGCSYVPSPVAIGPYFIVVADNGVASCLVAKTGERLWMERLKGGHSASLLTGNGLVYFLSDHGVMTVVKPGPEFKVVAENVVGEDTFATPAFSDGRLYLRGVKHLFCIDG